MDDTHIYVLYDSKTGQPLAVHSVLAEDGNAARVPLKRAREELLLAAEVDPNRKVAVLEVTIPHRRSPWDYYVDLKQKRLVPKPTLRIEAQTHELEGDGEDSTRLDISVVDERGRISRGFAGEVVVATSRGRLSERGGRVPLKNGKASLFLRSAPETVNQVVVAAYDPAERCLPGTVELSFV